MSILLANNELQLGDQIHGAGTVGNILEDANLQGVGGAREVAGLFEVQLTNILGFLTLLGAMFFIVNFFVAAFNWLRSGDDKGQISKAQQKMTNSAIGLFIMVIAIGIVGIIGGVVGLDILNPAKIFPTLVPGGN